MKSILLIFLCSLNFAQEMKPRAGEFFKKIEVPLKGRLVHLTLEPIDQKQTVVVLQRSGSFPKWKHSLLFWSENNTFEFDLPQTFLFYDFFSFNSKTYLFGITPQGIDIYEKKQNTMVLTQTFSHPSAFEKISLHGPVPFEGVVLEKDPGVFGVPTRGGVLFLKFHGAQFVKTQVFTGLTKSYHRSSTETLPFELSFWVRGSEWFPKVVVGQKKQAPVLMSPWMDELTLVDLKTSQKTEQSFQKFSEAERDDETAQVLMEVVDLNNDGSSDVIVNKFKGSPTQMQAQTTLHLADAQGIPIKGIPLKPKGNRTAGVMAVDLNRDHKKDLITASSQFNTWAIIRALMRKVIHISFSMYVWKDPLNFDTPDFERTLSFDFDLSDFNIEGFLPSLEGDFNGDGYPDAFYAQKKNELSVLLQTPKAADLFPSEPKTTKIEPYKKFRLGDLNQDRLTDVVLYDRRSQKNKTVVVLVNLGNFR